MKNKFVLSLIILNLYAISVFGQDLKINIAKPVLRQHQDIFVKFDFPILGENLKKQSNNSFDIIGNSILSSSFIAKDTGEFQFGPIELIFDNKKYQSNTAKVKVLPPIEPKSGIYISSYYINERNIILVEQVYKAEIPKSDGNVKQYNYSYSKGNNPIPGFNQFIDIENRTKVKIKITQSDMISSPFYSSKLNRIIDSLYYSARTFDIFNYSGSKIILTKEYFKNLPSDFILPKIEIIYKEP